MKKLLVTTAIVAGLLAAGLSAQAGIFGHVFGASDSTTQSFAQRWQPVDEALRSDTFVAKGDDIAF